MTAIQKKDLDLHVNLRNLDDAYTVESAVFLDYCEGEGLNIVEGYTPFIEHLKNDGYEKDGKHYEYKANTINKYIQAARHRIRYAFAHSREYSDSLLNGLRLDEFLKSEKPVKKQSNAVPKNKVLSWDEVTALIAATRGTKFGLMIEFLARAGVRVSELVGIKLANIKPNGNGFDYVRIIGKGSKERTLKIDRELIGRIRETFAGSTYLFEHDGKPYNRISVTNRIKHVSLRYLGREISAHGLRHSFATEQLRRGRDLKAVSEYLGHSSVATTADIYLHSELSDEEADLGTNPVFSGNDEVIKLRAEVSSLKETMQAILDQFHDAEVAKKLDNALREDSDKL